MALAATMIVAGSAASATAACPNEDRAPARLKVPELRDSVVCVLNEHRAYRGLQPLSVNHGLQRAAQNHSKAMNKRNFFGHRDVVARARRTGYMRGASDWGLGEVLAWGKASPKLIVSAWMQSPGHRVTLLTPAFLEVGVGVVRGSPQTRKRRKRSAIHTVDFGYRR